MKTNTNTNPTIHTISEEQLQNPFQMLNATSVTANGGRKLAHTNQLVQVSHERATETIKLASDNAEFHALANQMMAGDPADCLELFRVVGVLDKVASDAEFLADADEAELKQLLESRRSDRSKLKKKGINSSMTVCHSYVSAMYAELLVRQAMGKPYTGARGAEAKEVDTTDLEAVNKKIKSLQSKACRLKQMADTPEVIAEREQVKLEIERLQAYRPAKAQVAVKSIKADELREALSKMDKADLPEEVLALLAKLG